MNDSPGWAPPGSSPSDEPDHGAQQQGEPADQPAPEQPARGATWAPRQPPPGHWTVSGRGPTPPPPTRPAAPTGGWSTGRRQPPAPRPGVIPLRPLAVSEILDGAVGIMRAHWRTVLGISLAVSIVIQGLITAATGLWFNKAHGNETHVLDERDVTVSEAMRAVGNAFGDSGVALLLGVLGTIVTTALMTVVAARAVLGRSVTIGEAWAGARPYLLQLCGLLLLVPAIAMAVIAAGMTPGLLLAAAGVPSEGAALASLGGLAGAGVAAWLWIRFSLAPAALMLEKQGIIPSLRRSSKLVRGAWGRVFGVQLLAVVLVFVVGAIVEIPTSLVAMLIGGDNAMDWLSGESVSVSWTFLAVVGVGGAISSTITFPISAGVTALLYMDQRIRREALDLELARAAGMRGDHPEGHGTDQPTVGSTSGN
ncbi:hypothetical protein [Streptomyces sp. S465]|uniref:hypothetical protein n=1 Tax=Streptomyces sp. S465 TaxID=2979468 RepID=UPI0022A84ED3|nr:hypothetical protein [Streptomyces sp. S465]WAP56420.1 hypothetical protein N6H00_16410 [Streptomyces sp. S465]